MKKLKRILALALSLVLIASVIPTNVLVSADTVGTGGGSDDDSGSGGADLNEKTQHTAVFGARVYLVPTTVLFSSDVSDEQPSNVKDGSTFEDYAKYATYVIYKTKVAGGIYRPSATDKFTFSKSDQVLTDFSYIKSNSDNATVKIKAAQIYKEGSGLIRSLIDTKYSDYKSTAKAPKVNSGATNYRYAESCLSDFEGHSFYTNSGDTTVFTRNYAVECSDSKFFNHIIDANPKLEDDTQIDKNIKAFGKYTEGLGLGFKYDETKGYSIVIEPVWGYVNVNLNSGKPVLMTAQSYARWVYGKTSNWNSKAGTGILNERIKPNYIKSRTANSAVQKLSSLTAHNFCSTLRPYTKSISAANQDFGGFGIVYGGGAQTMVRQMGIYTEYTTTIGTASVNNGGKYTTTSTISTTNANAVDRSSEEKPFEGSLENFCSATVNKNFSKGSAKQLNTSTNKKKYYTFVFQVGKKDEENNLKNGNVADMINKLDFFNSSNCQIKLKNGLSSSMTNAISGKITGKAGEKTGGKSPVQPNLVLTNNGIEFNYNVVPNNTKAISSTLLVYEESVPKAVKYNFFDKTASDSVYRLYSNKSRYAKGYDKSAVTYIDKPNSSADSIGALTSQYSGRLVSTDSGTVTTGKGYVPVTVAIKESYPSVYSYYVPISVIKNVKTGGVDYSSVGSARNSKVALTSNATFSCGTSAHKRFVIEIPNLKSGGTAFIGTNGTINTTTIKNAVVNSIKKYRLFNNNATINTSALNSIGADVKNTLASIGSASSYMLNGTSLTVKNYINNTSKYVSGKVCIVVDYQEYNTPGESDGQLADANATIPQEYLNTISDLGTQGFNRSDICTDIYDGLTKVSAIAISDDTSIKTFLSRTGFNFNVVNSGVYTNNGTENSSYVVNSTVDMNKVGSTNLWQYTNSFNSTVTNGHSATANATGKQPYKYFALSRSAFNDNKKIANFSVYNTGNMSPSAKVNNVSRKDIFSKLGFSFDVVPSTVSTSGSTETEKRSSTVTLNIAKLNNTGWLIKDIYREVSGTTTVNKTYTKYVPANYGYIKSEIKNGEVVSTCKSSGTYTASVVTKKYRPYKLNNNIDKDASTQVLYDDGTKTTIGIADTDSTKSLGVYPEVAMKFLYPNSFSFTTQSINNTINGYTADTVFVIGETPRYFRPTAYHVLDTEFKGDGVATLTSTGESTSTKKEALLDKLGVEDDTKVILSGADIGVTQECADINSYISSYVVDIKNGTECKSALDNSDINLKSVWSSLGNNSTYNPEVVHTSIVNELAKKTLDKDIKSEVKLSIPDNSVNEKLNSTVSTKTATSGDTVGTKKEIMIRNGEVTNKDDIITWILSDLKTRNIKNLTDAVLKAQAEKIYSGLNIESAIVPIFETSVSSENRSDGKWYSECCTTLIIRRYVTPLKTKVGMTASDKLDITYGAKQKVDGLHEDSLYQNGVVAQIDSKLYSDVTSEIELPSTKKININFKLDFNKTYPEWKFVIPDATISDSRY